MKYELYYSTGGHGGPYRSPEEAEEWAKRHLSGDKRMKTVEIRPYDSKATGGFKPGNPGSKYIHATDKTKIAQELVAIARSLTAEELPLGHFLVTKDFKIHFGAWSMGFRKGDVLRSERGHLYGFDSKRGDWVERHPPISGETSFSLGDYGYGFEQREQLKNFISSTKSISPSEAKRLTIDSEQRMTVQVKDIAKVISQLGLRPTDEVVLIVPPQS